MHCRVIKPLTRSVLICAIGALAGCSTLDHTGRATVLTTPASAAVAPGKGEEIALRAMALVGKPYRYGGADLDGFDCSGLVYFIHQAMGIAAPRTAAQQQQAAMSVPRAQLLPGDLVFFKTTSRNQVSHVGIYVGDNRFVHAPQTGKLIELRTLDDAYYGSRLIGTGRLYMGS